MNNQDNPYANQGGSDPYNPYSNYNYPGGGQPWEPPAEPAPPPPPTYDTPYAAPNPYAGSNYSNSQDIGAFQHQAQSIVPPYARARQGRRSWPCSIVMLLITLLLCGGVVAGGIYAYNTLRGSASGLSSVPFLGSDITTFTVGSEPTLVIDRNSGPIHVRGSNGHTVTIKAFSSPNTAESKQVPYTLSNNNNLATLDASDFETDDLVITVPTATNLKLNTNGEDITVSGVNGAMTLGSNAGTITVTQSTVSGPASFDTNGGGIRVTGVTMTGSATFSTNGEGITFDGSIDPQGTYKFTTSTGPVDITLPPTSSFHADLTSDTNTVTSDFPAVKVTSNTVGSEAHGDVGQPPRATITVTDSTGALSLHKST